MKFTLLLLLALPFAALAQDDPQTVYSKMHKAILAANVGEALKYSTEARRKEIDALPAAQKTATVQMIAKLMPQTYTVASSTIAPDGKTAEVRTSGMAASLMGGKPETSYGVISLVKEKNEWKVDKSEWSNQKPAGMVLVQAAPAPAPAAQAAPAAEKEDVDANEEEAKKARAEEEAAARKKAAEDAAAERQRQKEARMALCVIRPVMSDEQIELCRVAYKD